MKLENERSRKIWREVRVRCFSLLVLRRQKIRRGSRRNGEGEGGRRQIFSWFWVCVRVCLSTCHAECDNKIADTSLRMPRKPREKEEKREREKGRGRKITCRCHSAATFYAFPTKNRKNNPK